MSGGEAMTRASVLELAGGLDVAQVYVHCPRSVPNTLPRTGLDRYCERALLLAREHDVVCVGQPVEADYLGFLAGFGIGPCSQNVLQVPAPDGARSDLGVVEAILATPKAVERIAERVAGSPQTLLNPKFAGAREFALAARLGERLGMRVEVLGGDPHVVNRVNLKHVVRSMARELGIAVARGEIVDAAMPGDAPDGHVARLELAVERQARRTGRALVRGSCGASGSATWIVAATPAVERRRLLEELISRNGEATYLVDEMVDLTLAPNVLMYVAADAGPISLLAVSDQRLDERLAWQGSAFPSRTRLGGVMIDAARRLCEWLQLQGYTGFAGFDFAEYVDRATGRHRQLLAELNPRVNGVTYPLVLMQRLDEAQRRAHRPPIGAFVSGRAPTSLRSFAALRERYGKLFFEPATGRGMFPFNTGCLAEGTFDYAFFGGNEAEVAALHSEFQALGREE